MGMNKIRERVIGAVAAVAVAGFVFTWAVAANADDMPATQDKEAAVVAPDVTAPVSDQVLGEVTTPEAIPAVAIPAAEVAVDQTPVEQPAAPPVVQAAPADSPATTPAGDCSVVVCANGVPVPTDGSTITDESNGYSDPDGNWIPFP